jgi:hypothetical protein
LGARWQKFALLAPPAIAVCVVALGLRLGAADDVMGAQVFAAPPATARQGLAWAVHVMREDRGVREPAPDRAIAVMGRTRDGREARWEGTTDEAGVAEAWLALANIAPGEHLKLQVTSGALTLASGETVVPESQIDGGGRTTVLPAARRDGAIELDVVIPSRALATEFPTRVLFYAKDKKTRLPRPGVHLMLEPDPGLETSEPTVVTCRNGWAGVLATARAHVVGGAIHARASDGNGGEWYGAWPTAGGAFYVGLPDALEANAPRETFVAAPGLRHHVYVEANDKMGRASAVSVELARQIEPMVGAGYLRAPLTLPAMAPGIAWIVTSSDATGAETMSGATLAMPIVVGPKNVTGASFDACELWPEMAAAEARGFPKTRVLDGFVPIRAALARARRRGLGLALAAVILSAFVETVLLLRHARRARIELERARDAMDEAMGEAGIAHRWVDGRAGVIAVGLGIALLGFALLTALLLGTGRT